MWETPRQRGGPELYYTLTIAGSRERARDPPSRTVPHWVADVCARQGNEEREKKYNEMLLNYSQPRRCVASHSPLTDPRYAYKIVPRCYYSHQEAEGRCQVIMIQFSRFSCRPLLGRTLLVHDFGGVEKRDRRGRNPGICLIACYPIRLLRFRRYPPTQWWI